MEQRPELTGELDGAAFRSYYYLKEELTAFCRANGLPASGGKQELTGRIAHYLDTGEILPAGPAARGRALKRWFKKFVMNISFLLIVWRMQRRLCFVM